MKYIAAASFLAILLLAALSPASVFGQAVDPLQARPACGNLPGKPASLCPNFQPACLCDARGTCKWQWLCPVAPPTPANPGGSAASSPLPTSPGVYWLDPDSGTHVIEGAPAGDAREENGLVSRLTLGIRKARMLVPVDGDSAHTRVGERRPRFYIYVSQSGRAPDYVLARMEQREDEREIPLGPKDFWEDRPGVDPSAQVPLNTERLNDHLFLVTPGVDLIVGEYAFVPASGALSEVSPARVYDFGIE